MSKQYIIIVFISLFIYSCNSKPESTAVEQEIDYRTLKYDLDYMYDRDQEIRQILVDSIGFDSPETGKYITKMMEIDSLNQIRVREILEKYNWLPVSKVGEKASSALFAVVQHSNLEMMEKYYPQLKKLADEGEASPIAAAMMEDRILMNKGQKQKYGTQASSELREDGSAAIWPIENPDIVDSLRSAIGFDQTVLENAKRLEAEYNPEEKLPAKE